MSVVGTCPARNAAAASAKSQVGLWRARASAGEDRGPRQQTSLGNENSAQSFSGRSFGGIEDWRLFFKRVHYT